MLGKFHFLSLLLSSFLSLNLLAQVSMQAKIAGEKEFNELIGKLLRISCTQDKVQFDKSFPLNTYFTQDMIDSSQKRFDKTAGYFDIKLEQVSTKTLFEKGQGASESQEFTLRIQDKNGNDIHPPKKVTGYRYLYNVVFDSPDQDTSFLTIPLENNKSHYFKLISVGQSRLMSCKIEGYDYAKPEANEENFDEIEDFSEE